MKVDNLMKLVPRPCAKEHPNPKETAKDCPFCWKNEARPAWRMAYSGTLAGLNPSLPPPKGSTAERSLPAPCTFIGPFTGETVECKVCQGHVKLKIRECGLHGTCTEGKKVDGHACCKGCPDRKPSTPMPIEWVSTAQLAIDSIKLAGKLPHDVVAIAGIPRSGMIPASIIAAHLHLPLWELNETGTLRQLGTGRRGKGFNGETGRIAVIDDTVYDGNSMKMVKRGLKREAVFAAVYTRIDAPEVIDYHVRALGDVHLLEWNLCNSGPFVGKARSPIYAGGIAVDLDGIIVHDHESGGGIDNPYLVPRLLPCKLIVTGRPERMREVTEAQLRKLGVKWKRLEMFPEDEIPADLRIVAAYKAKHYGESDCGFFLESHPGQAEEIHRLTKKPVICPIIGKVFQL